MLIVYVGNTVSTEITTFVFCSLCHQTFCFLFTNILSNLPRNALIMFGLVVLIVLIGYAG